MIYDCFLFFNELDLLEIRLNVLDSYVDRFVLVESTTTFSGNKKPLLYKQNKDRFKKFNHKIIHLPIEINQSPLGNWDREYFQREHIKFGLKNCSDNDIIMVSDLDEIPKLDGINLDESIKKYGGVTFDMDVFYYYINVKTSEKWMGTYILPYHLIKNMNLSKLREENRFHKISKGWHFSYMGGIDKIKYKIESYSHQEFNNDSVKNNLSDAINNFKDPFGRIGEFTKVEIGSNHPKYLVDNLDKYNHLIKSD
jgi:beta-1,4-mannosyl-glycoprotein beta-1,4-N-acetylglucosaminyltransferase